VTVEGSITATPRRSAVRRFFLMEEEIAEAKARAGGAGEPGTAESRRALAALEAAECLLARRVRLEHSDGTAAAFGLVRQALWWALHAHAARSNAKVDATTSLAELWATVMKGPCGVLVGGLDDAAVEQARTAFVERGWEVASAPDDVRVSELRAMREVLARMLGPLEGGMARLTRLRVKRAARMVAVAGCVAAIAVAAWWVWRSHKRGPNLALGKQATASSMFPGYDSAAGAVDGNTTDIGFHTAQQERPWLLVDLGSEQTIRQVVVDNRGDCCKDRAVPLIVEASVDGKQFQPIARRDVEFSTWRAVFPPARARYVRFTADKNTWLHFNEVEIYPGE
jgi:hypothetical protein